MYRNAKETKSSTTGDSTQNVFSKTSSAQSFQENNSGVSIRNSNATIPESYTQNTPNLGINQPAPTTINQIPMVYNKSPSPSFNQNSKPKIEPQQNNQNSSYSRSSTTYNQIPTSNNQSPPNYSMNNLNRPMSYNLNPTVKLSTSDPRMSVPLNPRFTSFT